LNLGLTCKKGLTMFARMATVTGFFRLRLNIEEVGI